MAFTEPEQALIAEFLETEITTILSLQQIIDLAIAENDIVHREKSIYLKTQLIATDALNTRLVAKTPFINGGGSTLVYAPSHPWNGGVVVTAWSIQHLDVDLVTVIVDYSHAVAWDNDAVILAAEAKWNLFQSWQTSPIYGTDKKIVGLDSAIVKTADWILALQARNAEFRNG